MNLLLTMYASQVRNFGSLSGKTIGLVLKLITVTGGCKDSLSAIILWGAEIIRLLNKINYLFEIPASSIYPHNQFTDQERDSVAV